jgi:c-di-GMP-binding flagellar brake protein YcgR
MNLYFYCDNQLFFCTAIVIEREVRDNLPLLDIRITSSLKKIQRRQYFRFKYTLPIEYRILEINNPDGNEDVPFIKTFTRDIGGGGLSIAVLEKIQLKSIVECRLLGIAEKNIVFCGKAVRITKLSIEEKFNYNIGISFSKIENKDREEIIRFIFAEQRKLINKGLI